MIHMAAFSLNARNLNPLADHLSCSGKKVMLYEIVFYSCSSDKDSHYNYYSEFEWITGLALSFWLCD